MALREGNSQNANEPGPIVQRETTIRNAVHRYAGQIFSTEKDRHGSLEIDKGSAFLSGDYSDGFPQIVSRIGNGSRFSQKERELYDLQGLWAHWKRRLDSNIVCIVGQIEEAPSTGNLHIQFYMQLTRKVRATTAKKYLSHPTDRSLMPFLATCKGTHGQNIAYVTKESSRFESLPTIGTPVQPGKENEDGGNVGKIARLIQVAQQSGMRAALDELPVTGLQNIRNLQTYLTFTSQPRSSVRANIFLQGPPRCGKTRFAYEISKHKLYPKTHGKWFDGYSGEKIVLFDEINTLDIPHDLLLRVCDRYPLRLETKGSSCTLNSAVNIFTSNLDFDVAMFFRDKNVNPALRHALRDRFCLILELTDSNIDTVHWPIISLRQLVTEPQRHCSVVFGPVRLYIRNVQASDRFTQSEILQCFIGM
jgi:hypothetical protein